MLTGPLGVLDEAQGRMALIHGWLSSLFVLQPPGVPDYPLADGYAFSNTAYKRGPLLDQGAAVAAFKQTVSRHVDR